MGFVIHSRISFGTISSYFDCHIFTDYSRLRWLANVSSTDPFRIKILKKSLAKLNSVSNSENRKQNFIREMKSQ
jgi:hypothetical protein